MKSWMLSLAGVIVALLSSCKSQSSEPLDPEALLAEIVRVYGAATVQLYLVPAMQEKAPELFRLLDTDGDQILSEQEMLAFNPLSPIGALVVVTTVQRLLERHR